MPFLIKPIKKLGQNFLKDERILQRIADAAQISRDDIVLEIGTGTGNLTKCLCKKAKFVYTVEKDARLCKIAKENLKGFKNVEIICNDILNYPLNAIRYPLKIIGNLPYYISTPIIFRLLEQKRHISEVYITLQKELAERMIARPGSKDYGVLTCSVGFYTKPEILFNIDRSAFYPMPEVDSAFVKLRILKEPAVTVEDEALFFKIIKTSFNKRRKMLRSSLAALMPQRGLKGLLLRAGIDPTRRPETLSLNEFASIANAWQ